jgi:hypothetical protein
VCWQQKVAFSLIVADIVLPMQNIFLSKALYIFFNLRKGLLSHFASFIGITEYFFLNNITLPPLSVLLGYFLYLCKTVISYKSISF